MPLLVVVWTRLRSSSRQWQMRMCEVLCPKRGGNALNRGGNSKRAGVLIRHQGRGLFGYVRAVLSSVLFLYLLIIKNHERKRQLDT